jgi:hypothetical protein
VEVGNHANANDAEAQGGGRRRRSGHTRKRW